MKPNSIAEVHPNIFIKPACLGRDLGRQGDSLLSAVGLHYLRCVATFGTESMNCKMPVDSLVAAQGWHTGPGCASAPGGWVCSVTSLQGWDTLLHRPCWCKPSQGAGSSSHKCQHTSAVLTCARASPFIPRRDRLCHRAFSCLSQSEILLPGRGCPEGAGKHSPEMLPARATSEAVRSPDAESRRGRQGGDGCSTTAWIREGTELEAPCSCVSGAGTNKNILEGRCLERKQSTQLHFC